MNERTAKPTERVLAHATSPRGEEPLKEAWLPSRPTTRKRRLVGDRDAQEIGSFRPGVVSARATLSEPPSPKCSLKNRLRPPTNVIFFSAVDAIDAVPVAGSVATLSWASLHS